MKLQYIKVSFRTTDHVDGAVEQLLIDGATAGDKIALNFIDGAKINPVTLSGVTYQVRVSVNARTSTLIFTRDDGGYLTQAEGETLLKALRYQNTSKILTSGECQFTYIVKELVC